MSRVRREGFGHSHGYFVSFHSQNISFARPRLVGPEGPRLRLSNPSRRYQIQQNSSCRLSFGIWCVGKDLNLRRAMPDRFTVCCNWPLCHRRIYFLLELRDQVIKYRCYPVVNLIVLLWSVRLRSQRPICSLSFADQMKHEAVHVSSTLPPTQLFSFWIKRPSN